MDIFIPTLLALSLVAFLVPLMTDDKTPIMIPIEKLAGPKSVIKESYLTIEMYDVLTSMHMNARASDTDRFMSLSMGGVTLDFADPQALAKFINTHNPGSLIFTQEKPIVAEPEVNHRREAILAQKARNKVAS